MFNVLVQLLITARSFRDVEVAATNNIKVRGGEVEGRGDIVEVAIRYKLLRAC